MEKIKKIGLLFAIIAMVSSGCNNDADEVLNLTDGSDENIADTGSKEWFIGLEEAELVSGQFLNEHADVQLRSSGKEEIKRVSVITSAEKRTDTLMYVINFADGFVIVSATKKVFPILAYAETGFFDEKDTENIGPSIWLENVKQYLEKKIDDTATDEDVGYLDAYETWRRMLDKKKSDDTTLRAQYIHEIRNYKKIGPLLTTEWDQGSPYDSRTPIISGSHAPTGCVPLAIAQVVNYHQTLTGENINWSGISSNTMNDITELINIISSNIGMCYTSGYSYPTLGFPDIFSYRGRVVDYLNAHGYNTWFQSPGNQPPVTCPAIYEGFTANFIGTTNWFGGHWWVMEGYEQYDVYDGWFDIPTYSANQQQQGGTCYGVLFLYFNWGWGGVSNAWYAVSGSYTAGGDTYCQNFHRLNITKN